MAGNVRTVVSFEVARTLSKPRFWVATLLIPVLIGAIIVLETWSNSSTQSSAEQQTTAKIAFEYEDASGVVVPAIARAAGGTLQTDPAKGLADVQSGAVDAFIRYPTDPTTQPVMIAAKDVGLFANQRYDAIAKTVLTSSAAQAIGNPDLAALASGETTTQTTAYDGDRVASGLAGLIPPALYLLLFYLVLVLLYQQMLAATLEEKENRVTEMILTTITARSFVAGKIISIFIVGIVQMLVFAAPIALGYAFLRDQLSLPSLDLGALVFDPWQMTVGALILVGGFALFTGSLVAVGALMPSVKDAGPISAVFMVAMFVPLYTIMMIVSDPDAPLVRIFTFFPWTAPVTVLARNALSSLDATTAIIVIVEVYVVAAIVLWLAVRFFQYGAVEYGRKLDPRLALRSIRTRRTGGSAR